MQFTFLGPPGAGKGAQASILTQRWQIPHISTGDILREAIAGKTSLGIQAHTHLETGELVPDILVMALIRECFGKPDMKRGWILDGFPRTIPQAHALDQLLSIFRQPHPTVVYFEIATEVLVERMLARGRRDDNEDAIRRRLEIYQENTAPLIDFYQRRQCLAKINGNLPLGEVTSKLQELLLQYQYSSLV
ncbi:MAG: adenylate kinase [Symploca sp. SIO1C4]|uniref:Adenylate kinase n=1 Tax=Symploca sp. SIO1C4 TaxID=2607765 RepID=A0A6B3N947_9CYAN|nr:adenylate kinase [Symploca sp. SIO1C4]